MKKTMFKRIFAGIAAMFMMCLFLPIGFTGTDFKPSLETVAESGGWQTMYGTEYKLEGDTLIINNCKQPGTMTFDGWYFQSYAADIKHLEIGSGWKIGQVRLYLSSIQSLKVGDNCTIGKSAFWKCTALESVEIGNDCTIGESAFWECTALESVEIGNDCTIEYEAFWACTALESVEIGNGCTIGESAFWECTALKNVTIGNGCTIGKRAFNKCENIQKVIRTDSKDSVRVQQLGNPEIIWNKEKWTIPSKCPKCSGWVIDYKCAICGYYDEAALEAETARLNALKQKYGTNNNTASNFSNGSVLAIIGGTTFLILCGLAAVIIVKRRKKQN